MLRCSMRFSGAATANDMKKARMRTGPRILEYMLDDDGSVDSNWDREGELRFCPTWSCQVLEVRRLI